MSKKMVGLIVLAIALGGYFYMRFRMDRLVLDSEIWHINSESQAAELTKPNGYTLSEDDAGVFPIHATELAQKFDDFAMAQPSTTRLSGDVETGKITYVQRTKLMRYPDVITVRFREIDADNSTFTMFSRSVVGHSDLGVNQKRALQWLDSFAQIAR
ncbi:hypothetical protein GCM10008927_00580 [Amylibacter ulvae]|uniref:DUF1499 domain-containing protein n=1 Tax=Paramylibacter ulvae TaxID=1651968 RepID=A0ABQ3CR71_9RHOB|nr:DUF1499 domain-containing protein [Amylibacter ulvae]GHA40345.1 hypothetical protein GCM10008927_00580 [Amylibacter ulvae]